MSPKSNPDFISTLIGYQQLVWPYIQKHLDLLTSFPEFCQVDKKYQSLLDFHQLISSDYPLRHGKYLRPSLILMIAQSMGVSPKLALNTAAAMQLSEEWILIHDDIEDDSRERRGKPTLHQTYGKELAINAGDGLHSLMWYLLFQNQKILGSHLSQKISSEFSTMLFRTVFGQTIEIKWAKENNLDLVLEDILLILESKTVYYTIAGPLRLGAILGGASNSDLNHLYNFGRFLGYAFQIQDDLLDITSSFSGLKKQTGNDIYEGKRTVMLIHLLQNIDPKNKKKLISILNKSRSQKTATEVTWVIKKMAEFGSLDFSKNLVKTNLDSARQYFHQHLGFIKKEPYRSQVINLIDFLANRDH
ncbi:MAG: polyprenyl synthetase family protein [Candidatus Shapirobacteria bacterium]|jgi:geranylgeranyl diphosphate synthase type II